MCLQGANIMLIMFEKHCSTEDVARKLDEFQN